MKKVYIKGLREERLFLEEDDLEIYGDGPEKSILLGHEYAYREGKEGRVGTFNTATLFVSGNNIHIHDLKIVNDNYDSKTKGQALALYADGKNMLVENCVLDSAQDTLFISPLPEKERIPGGFKGPRQFHPRLMTSQLYRHCTIIGDIDFIFGSGRGVFEDCTIISRGPGYVAAPSTPEGQRGFLFKRCVFKGLDLEDESVYLARPWREAGEAVFEDCIFEKHIKKEKFSGWNRPVSEETKARFSIVQKGEFYD